MCARRLVSGLFVWVVVFAVHPILSGIPAAGPRADRFLVLYKVDDLLGKNDFEAPRLGVSIPAKGDSGFNALEKGKREERRQKELRELADGLRAVASEKDSEVKIKQLSSPLRLAVTSTKEGHARIQRLIRRLSVDRQTQVTVRLAIVPVDAELLKGLDETSRQMIEKQLPRLRKGEKVELAPALIDDLIRLTAGRYDASYHLPRVTAFSGQLSHTLVVNQAALIADLKVEERAGKKFAKPVIGVLSTGFVSEIRPTVVNVGKGVSVDLRFEFVEKIGMDVKFASELEAYRDVEGADQIPLQFPQLNRVGLQTSVVVPLDRWALLGGVPGAIRMYRKDEKPKSAATTDAVTLFFVGTSLIETGPKATGGKGTGRERTGGKGPPKG